MGPKPVSVHLLTRKIRKKEPALGQRLRSLGGLHLIFTMFTCQGGWRGHLEKCILDGRMQGETGVGRSELCYTEDIRGEEEHANGDLLPTLR